MKDSLVTMLALLTGFQMVYPSGPLYRSTASGYSYPTRPGSKNRRKASGSLRRRK